MNENRNKEEKIDNKKLSEEEFMKQLEKQVSDVRKIFVDYKKEKK